MKAMQVRVLFDRKGQATQKKAALVQLEVRFNKERKFIGTGVKVFKGQFKNGRIVGRSDADTLNEKINAMYKYVHEVYNESLSKRIPFALTMLNDGKVYQSSHPFLDWCRKRTEEKRCSDSTRRQNHLFCNLLSQFGKILAFDDATLPNIHRFDDFLKTYIGHNTGRPLTDNSVKAYHSRMRAFLSEATTLGFIKQNPYDHFKCGRCQTMPRMYLTMEELNTLRTWTPPKSRDNSRQKALDLFLVQCYTGLSYSDLMTTDFTKAESHNGNLILPRTTRVKTGTQFYIMLLPPVIEILERYAYKLPYFHLNSYTAQLKLISQETNIGKHITSHVGRHTFATTIALGSGIPIEVVSKMLGHTNIQTTQIYAKILPKQVMDGFNKIKDCVQ
jgi:site-specific recombinase XerD